MKTGFNPLPKKRFYPKKTLTVIIVLLAFWWLTPTFIKSFTRISFFEFQAPLWNVSSHLSEMQQFWSLRSHSKFELLEAGSEIARLNAAQKLRLQEFESQQAELTRLEQLLNLPSHPQFRYEVARVTRRDMSGWWQQMVISKGENYNIPNGAAVVYSGGVVGRVKEVHARTAVIELVSSRAFRMAAHFKNDERPVTYRGGSNLSFAAPKGQVSHVQADLTVNPQNPWQLVSSRLGGVFPDGLTIGLVDRLTLSNDGLFKTGSVRLDKRLLSLHEVAVVMPVEIPQVK